MIMEPTEEKRTISYLIENAEKEVRLCWFG